MLRQSLQEKHHQDYRTKSQRQAVSCRPVQEKARALGLLAWGFQKCQAADAEAEWSRWSRAGEMGEVTESSEKTRDISKAGTTGRSKFTSTKSNHYLQHLLILQNKSQFASPIDLTYL